jgi:hypothetical protein
MDQFEKQRRELKRMEVRKIQEYGVPGMKWGVRNVSRKPLPLKLKGHIGSNVYTLYNPSGINLTKLATKIPSARRKAKTSLGKSRLSYLKGRINKQIKKDIKQMSSPDFKGFGRVE